MVILFNVDYKDDGSCREDFAQGFPVNVIEKMEKLFFKASFDVLNTSGKFTEDGVMKELLRFKWYWYKLTNFLVIG